MKTYWWEALLLIAVACFACAPNTFSRGVIAPTERVIDRDTCLDIMCQRFSPYYRPGFDPNIGIVNWLISDRGHACVVTDVQYVMAIDGELFPCTNWRFRRP